jgi:choline dehydrogenase
MFFDNQHVPTIMIAEKAADLIRAREALPPLDVPVYIAPDWETAQR